MSYHHSEIRQWMRRTVGSQGSAMNNLVDNFTLQFPEANLDLLDEHLEDEKDFIVDDDGNIALSPAALKELEHLGDHEQTDRVKRNL